MPRAKEKTSKRKCFIQDDFAQDKQQLRIVGITNFRGSFVFSQSRVKVSANLTNVASLAVGAFDLVTCSLSVVEFVPVFNVGQ